MGLYEREPIKVGFWRGRDGDQSEYPDVRSFIDWTWNPNERALVAAYVSNSRFRGEGYRGWSDCRICGRNNGSSDFSDRVYVWPEGFVHYIRDHGVKPPSDFVAHVVAQSRR
jgi:hypothetical protein